jgi:hypothetical protein
VELRIELRRFRCRSRDCARKTFVERLPRVLGIHARQTARLSETIRLIGYALGGEAGARLAQRLGVETKSRYDIAPSETKSYARLITRRGRRG